MKAPQEKGQSIVLIVFMIIGILAFVGLAADAGFLFARSAQFSAAVDAAALAGVVELHQEGGVISATNRAGEFLDANGWPIAQTIEYTGTQAYTDLGIPEFTYTVTWPVQTFFLRVIGFEDIPITRASTAAYYALNDMPLSTQEEQGLLRKAAHYVYGPDSCTSQGDPVSATKAGVGVANPHYPIMNGVYLYRIRVPADYITDTGQSLVEIQLFDPDSINTRHGNSEPVSFSTGDPPAVLSCSSLGNGDTCIIETGEPNAMNPIWLRRVDETWRPTGDCPNFDWNDGAGNTVTNYRLFYRDEDEKPVDLASFESSGANAASTDMQWVSPGSPGHVAADSGSFTVNLNSIPLDGAGAYNILLEVEATAGTSKNGFDIWAAPPSLADTLDAYRDVNQRNLQILQSYTAYDTRGVQVFAQGYMPTTVYAPHSAGDPVTLPLASVDAREGGGAIYLTPFDYDSAATLDNNVTFGFDTLAPGDFSIAQIIDCGGDCNNNWVDPQYDFGIPTIDDGVAFYGGNLTVEYAPGQDEHVWSVRLTSGRPFLTR